MSHEFKIPDLNYVAMRLEGLEETIISKLIDRAQFSVNETVYAAGKSGFTGEPDLCLFDIRMRYHEQMDAHFGRFCVPEERPFTRNLPQPQRIVSLVDTGLHIDNFENVNLTVPIRSRYMELVGSLCRTGDDGQYGSSVEHDVYAIQAISRRIHYGAFYIAECKFNANPVEFNRLATMRDINTLEQMLTRKEVEQHIINRVAQKTREMQKPVNPEIRHIIDPELIVQFYRDTVIPLTKQGEIAYFLHRNESGKRPSPKPDQISNEFI